MFACEVFANRRGRQLQAAIVHVNRPLRASFMQEMHDFHTVRGTRHLMTKLSLEGLGATISDTWQQFLDTGFVREVDLAPAGAEDMTLKVDSFIVDRVYTYVVHLCGHLEAFSRIYTTCAPHIFVDLLSPEHQAPCLEILKTSWAILKRLEEDALENHDVKSFVRDLYFPSSGWCREIFIALEECDFQGSGDDIYPPPQCSRFRRGGEGGRGGSGGG